MQTARKRRLALAIRVRVLLDVAENMKRVVVVVVAVVGGGISRSELGIWVSGRCVCVCLCIVLLYCCMLYV